MSNEKCRPMAELRARKAGIALQIQRKLEERYDTEAALGTPEAIIDWINKTLQGEHPPLKYDKKKGLPWRSLQNHLGDGVAICKLVNKLLASQGKKPVKLTEKANSAFLALANIETFTNAAQDYGLGETEIFQSIDLQEGYKGPLCNVINCLNKLGVVANKNGFEPMYEEIAPPTRDNDLWDET